MRILLTGALGQLGTELLPRLQGLGEVTAVDRAECDLADADAVRRLVAEVRPEAILNPAAYTAVNEAERNPQLAIAINRDAPALLAAEARRLGAFFMHYSTDYVFDGSKSSPWVEEDTPAPLNMYGASKLAGERAVAAAGGRWLLLRTSWVYSGWGNNFLLTMRRMAREREELKVVDDQVGAPTPAGQLAAVTVRLLQLFHATPEAAFPAGLYHCTAGGSVSWCGFARAIVEALREHEALRVQRILALSSEEFPSPARRPLNSVLSNDRFASRFGFRLPEWQQGLAEVLEQLRRREAAAAAR